MSILYTDAQRIVGDEPAALLYLHPSSEQVLLAVEPTAISAAESLTGTTVATLLHPPHAYAYLSGRVVAWDRKAYYEYLTPIGQQLGVRHYLVHLCTRYFCENA